MSRLTILGEKLLSKKGLLGLLTIWLLLYFLVGEILRSLLPFETFIKFYLKPLVQVIGVGTGIIGFGLIWFYIWHLYKKVDYFSLSTKRIWLVIFILSGAFGIPIYFYRYIWCSQTLRDQRSEFRQAVFILTLSIVLAIIMSYYYFKIVGPRESIYLKNWWSNTDKMFID